jgi:hypothetical protein
VRDQVSHPHKTSDSRGFLYFDLYVPRQQAGREKTLNRTVANVPWIYSALNLFVHAILIC